MVTKSTVRNKKSYRGLVYGKYKGEWWVWAETEEAKKGLKKMGNTFYPDGFLERHSGNVDEETLKAYLDESLP